MSVAIDCQKLSKRYGRSKVYALKDLTLQVKAGEIYGFLGPNGAGKSTTIRTLMNFIQPTAGSATILGLDIVKDSVAIKRSVGYMSGELSMYPKLTGAQFLDYMDELQPATSQAYRQELVKRFKADLNKPLGDLSRGNRQKIGIVQAFMHQPAVLILDEPTSGLDPLMQEVFYELMEETKQRGAAVFSSSHILGEVQKMCDRVGIIREGKLIAERVVADMATEAAQTFDIVFKEAPPLSALKKVKGLQSASHHGNTVTIHFHGELSPLFAELAKHKILKLDSRTLDLEEVFLRFYKDKGGWE
ncbi:MAG TPA: ABC transporter ATP-binding protein [Candidatus Dormibacteraeota bacterium]|nr:ABC transporter ATP-binding protein [Candidatus Dormibacteraeota bacterium]